MQGKEAFLNPALNCGSFCRSLLDAIHYFFSDNSGRDEKKLDKCASGNVGRTEEQLAQNHRF